MLAWKSGVYNKTCFLELIKDFRDGKEWSIQIKEVDYETSLRALQINDIQNGMNWKTIDFFKIDMEWAELFLFSDLSYAESFLTITKIIAIEIHHEYNIKDAIIACLRTNNFQLMEHWELLIGINGNYSNTNYN